jgi:hypothetical protein
VSADDTVDRLIADLDEAIEVLDGVGEAHWRTWLQLGRNQIAGGDAHGLDHVLGAFGGMGSFNDLVLSQPGADRPVEELRAADDRLWELRESIWHGCRDLKHQLAE